MLSTKFEESLNPLFPIANKIKLLILRIKLKGIKFSVLVAKNHLKYLQHLAMKEEKILDA